MEHFLFDLDKNISFICFQIYPLFGPKQGGTLLTIEGIDLGKSYEDIVSNVDIAGVQCSPIRKEYVESRKWVGGPLHPGEFIESLCYASVKA